MINETLTDLTVETLHDLAVFAIRATRDAAFDQGRHSQGAKIASEVKTFAKLRCQLVKRRAGDGDAYEVVISSGGQFAKAEPKPTDGPSVSVDPQLPAHLMRKDVRPITDLDETYRQGTLTGLTAARVASRLTLDFAVPNCGPSGDGKVVNCWKFEVSGVKCSIWDYKGSHRLPVPVFSTFGPHAIFQKLFGDAYTPGIPSTVEERVKAGQAVPITDMIKENEAKRDAGKIPSFLDRTVKSHGSIEF